jgi:hypothetical protein
MVLNNKWIGILFEQIIYKSRQYYRKKKNYYRLFREFIKPDHFLLSHCTIKEAGTEFYESRKLCLSIHSSNIQNSESAGDIKFRYIIFAA